MTLFTRFICPASVTLLVFSLSGHSRLAPVSLAAQSAPQLSIPATGPVVNVSTEAELHKAVAVLKSNTTITLAAGTYRLTGTLRINGPLKNVSLRGATSNPDDVVLVGPGMTNKEFGAVPHGISVGRGVQGITIANLAIRDVFQHSILLEPGTLAPHISNVRFLNAGREFIKAGSDGSVDGVSVGVVEHSTFEYTTTSAGGSTNGIEVVAGRGWKIRGNLFRNIKAPSGQLAGPAVLLWRGSRESAVEGNTFINCQREIAFGMEQTQGGDHQGGVIRNNFIYRESSVAGDAAILVADSPRTEVLHNTILANGSSTSLIESRFPAAAGVVIRNNLLDGQISSRDGARATVENNYTAARPDLFANAAAGDLHLVGSAAGVIDAVPAVPGAAADWDGQPRPQGAMADYGADEFAGGADTATRSATLSSESLAASTSPTAETQTLSGSLTAAATSSGLPSPWQTRDIGNPARSGVTAYASGIFVVQAAGSDIGGTADQFRFVYQTLDGDGEVVARVESLDRTSDWAKAGVMIRDELTAESKHAFVMVTAGMGLAFQRRLAEGAWATQTPGDRVKAPYWVKLKRVGDTFTALSSIDGVNWKRIGTDTVSNNRLAYVGLAVTSKSASTLTNAVFSNVKVTPGSNSLNRPPVVSISEPSAGASYTAPATVSVAAQATDSDGSVTKVDFYAGSSLIGSDSASPFNVTWTDAPAGKHTLKAVAHDDDGASATSTGVEITVGSNQPPVVGLTSPTQNESFSAPASITMTAAASDVDGTISKVEFYAGSTRVGSDTSSPYSITWSNAAAGAYTLSAKAWDNSGASMISAGVNITIREANKAPTVSLTAPAAGATFTAGTTIILTANASDSDGTVAWVDFYAGSTLIGSDPTNSYSATWSNVPAGSYNLKAVARDNSGATASSSVSITVTTVSSTLPRAVIFNASADHAIVTSYAVEVFKGGANPSTTAPVRAQNIGKPQPTNGEITVDVSSMVQALPAGTYFFTVSAISSGGTSRSGPTETFTR